MYTKETESFGNVVSNDTEPEVTAFAGIFVQQIVEKGYLSNDNKLIYELK